MHKADLSRNTYVIVSRMQVNILHTQYPTCWFRKTSMAPSGPLSPSVSRVNQSKCGVTQLNLVYVRLILRYFLRLPDRLITMPNYRYTEHFLLLINSSIEIFSQLFL